MQEIITSMGHELKTLNGELSQVKAKMKEQQNDIISILKRYEKGGEVPPAEPKNEPHRRHVLSRFRR